MSAFADQQPEGNDTDELHWLDVNDTYEVVWTLKSLERSARAYGDAIRENWYEYRGVHDEHRIIVKSDVNEVILGIGTNSNDVHKALNETRNFVFGCIERANLPLPNVIMVGVVPTEN